MKEHASLKEGAHKNEGYSFRSTALFISLELHTKYKYGIGINLCISTKFL